MNWLFILIELSSLKKTQISKRGNENQFFLFFEKNFVLNIHRTDISGLVLSAKKLYLSTLVTTGKVIVKYYPFGGYSLMYDNGFLQTEIIVNDL